MELQSEKYGELAEFLRDRFPKSIPIYYLLEGIQKHCLEWTDQVIFVDRFPEPRAVISRPKVTMTASGQQLYLARPICYTVSAWSEEPEALRTLALTDGVLHWDEEMMLNAISCPDDVEVLAEVCRKKGEPHAWDDEGWCCDVYELRPETIIPPSLKLPEGFSLGQLQPQHATQVNKDWEYGGNAATQEYLEAVLANGKHEPYPSAAILDPSGNPVSYIIAEPENVMAMGHTSASYRNKGFFGIVNYVLAQKLFKMGRPAVYVQVHPTNMASINAYKRLGAVKIEGWKQHWFLFKPRIKRRIKKDSVHFNFERNHDCTTNGH